MTGASEAQPSTGLPALDRVLERLIDGDNVVWQVGSIDDYIPFVQPYCHTALQQGRTLIYFHFERHRELIAPDPRVQVHRLDPASGFETLTAEIHRIIARAGRGAFYLFDSLSDLAADWYSDLMVGNFFRVTCPYLRELDTIAYFALLRGRHSYRAVATIRDTTQLLIDVHQHRGKLHVHPQKVFGRYSPTMYLPHVQEGDLFRSVTDSATISGIYETLTKDGPTGDSDRLDLWDRTFQSAHDLASAVRRGDRAAEALDETVDRLLHMLVSRNDRMLALARKHLTISDLFAVRRRMIGTGMIGGKAAGMLIARAVLHNDGDRWRDMLEPHDSFFVGSDVFYSYLVSNGCWPIRQKQRDPEQYLSVAEEAQAQMLSGKFPDFVREQFAQMLDYFGQAPIVVRSSSLLEDSFGNAFSGKYESVFCPNQGSPQERLDAFLQAVRQIYASAMGPEALAYRAQRGLLDCDEQMALLVQRVSGAVHGRYFFPQVAGVALSFNPYKWSEQIDPKAGMLRIVFGLGTRAVRRSDNDYTRIVALNAPERRPETTSQEIRGYAQWRVDLLDLESNEQSTRSFEEVVQACGERCIEMVGWRDPELTRRARETGRPTFPWVLTFRSLLSDTNFVSNMRHMLSVLERAYEYPVDVEFTANFLQGGNYRINLVQCRPFQVKAAARSVALPSNIEQSDVLLRAAGAVIGPGAATRVGRIIYVAPAAYDKLTQSERYSVARLVGRLTRLGNVTGGALMLIGPGRWGTSEPALGVPVSFAEIGHANVLCEVLEMREGLIPDVSLGTHFFNDLVEREILYLGLVPGKAGNWINSPYFDNAPNDLLRLLPGEEAWADAVRVIHPEGDPPLRMHANALEQQAVCYFAGQEA